MIDRWCPSFSGNTGLQLPSTTGRTHLGLSGFSNNANDSYKIDSGQTALSLDGTATVASAATRTLQNPQGTVSLWVNTTLDSAKAVFSYADPFSVNDSFTIYIGDGVTGTLASELVTMASVRSGSAIIFAYVTTTRSILFDGKWHNLIVTSNGKTWAFFFDGQPINLTFGFGANNGNWFDNNQLTTVMLGARLHPTNTPSTVLNGLLDDYIIMNAGITAPEARFIFEQGRGGGLLREPPKRRSFFVPTLPFPVRRRSSRFLTFPG
jgi:hypothetical protein